MVRLLVLLLFVPFLSGAPGAPRQQQAGPELIAATCSLSSVAAHSLVTTPALKLVSASLSSQWSWLPAFLLVCLLPVDSSDLFPLGFALVFFSGLFRQTTLILSLWPFATHTFCCKFDWSFNKLKTLRVLQGGLVFSVTVHSSHLSFYLKTHSPDGRCMQGSIPFWFAKQSGISVFLGPVFLLKVFSTAGDIITAQRSCITPQHIDQLFLARKSPSPFSCRRGFSLTVFLEMFPRAPNFLHCFQ